MSNIARWNAAGGEWVRYGDHRAEVERLKEQVAALTVAVEQADEAKADAEAAATAEEAETDRVMAERDAAQAEVERLKEQVAALTLAVEQADAIKAHAEASAAEEEAETDRLTAERDEAQTEVERLRANGQRMFDGSRPSDEDIWHHAFMATLQSPHYNRTKMADEVLAEYRKRWPR